MSLTLLRNVIDWNQYCTSFHANNLPLVAFDNIDWGKGPLSYPCLAASAAIDSSVHPRIISAFFYVENAKILLAASGDTTTATTPTGGPTQTEFNKHATAHLVTLLNVLIEKGVVTKDAYERKLPGNLALVDQFTAETRTQIERAVPGATVIIENLGD